MFVQRSNIFEEKSQRSVIGDETMRDEATHMFIGAFAVFVFRRFHFEDGCSEQGFIVGKRKRLRDSVGNEITEFVRRAGFEIVSESDSKRRYNQTLDFRCREKFRETIFGILLLLLIAELTRNVGFGIS